MTETAFKRMKKGVEKNGVFTAEAKEGWKTMVIKRAPFNYAVYSIEDTGGGFSDKYCVTTTDDLDKIKYIFVD